MSIWLLYTIVVLAWGTSWLAIQYQLGDVHPQISVAYRFTLAGLLLLIYCVVRGKNMAYKWRDHLRIAIMAVFLFSTNYILIYHSSTYLNSGLESIVFSTLIFMNIVNARVFLKQKITLNVLLASLVGFLGVMFIFSKELKNTSATPEILLGAALGLGSAYSASIGNMISSRNGKIGLPVLQSTAYGMLYGGLWTFFLAVMMGIPITFVSTSTYVISLIYLSVFASIIAFVSYLTLLERIGAARAAYCVLIFPIIAVTLSVFFEGYTFQWHDVVGMSLAIAGNYVVLFKPSV